MKTPISGISLAFRYDQETGDLFQNGSPKKAGYLTTFGYRLVSYKKQRIYAHRLIWFLMTGDWPLLEIDHINGNKSDNSWVNLRIATRQDNARNQGKTLKNTSGFKGVSFHKGKWRAVVKTDGKHRHLGYFNTKENAANAYRVSAAENFKEFARYE